MSTGHVVGGCDGGDGCRRGLGRSRRDRRHRSQPASQLV